MSNSDKARVSKSEILEIIKESPVPIGNFDICEIIEGGGKKQTIHSDEKRSLKKARQKASIKWKTNVSNHLKSLMDDGLIEREGQKYVSTHLVDKLEKIENSIKKVLSEKEEGDTLKSLKKSLGDEKFISAVMFLQMKGLIEGKWIVNNYREERDENNRYILSPTGYTSIHKCPVCKKDLDDSNSVITGILRTEQIISSHTPDYRTVIVHTKCYRDSGLIGEHFSRHDRSVICEYCGLPLSPKLIPKPEIKFSSIKDHLHEIGFGELIDFLDFVERTCHRPIIDFPATMPSGMAHPLAGEYFLDFKLLKEESIPKSIKARGEELEDLLRVLLRAKLTRKDQAELFVDTLSNIWGNLPENFEKKAVAIDIWKATKETLKEEEQEVIKLYEKLVGPGGLLHINMVKSSRLEEYVRRGLKTQKIPGLKKTLFTQTISTKKDGKMYHPYCARELEKGDERGVKPKN